METIFASNKQRKCIIISNLGLFWLKLDKMCNFFNSCEESLHWGVWKFAKYVRNYVVFWKNLHSWQNFYTTAGRDGRDKFQVCSISDGISARTSCTTFDRSVRPPVRLGICRNRRDRRSCKIFVSCVNFSRKQRSFLHILQVYTHLNVNFLHNC